MTQTQQKKQPQKLLEEIQAITQSILGLRTLQEENEKQIAALRRSQEETSKQMKKTEKEIAKFATISAQSTEDLKATIKQNEEKLTRMGITFGNFQNNLGDVAEETFYEYLDTDKQLADIRFDKVAKNMVDWDNNEYDIVMKNGKAMAVVEVKQKVHPSDIDKLVHKTIPAFKQWMGKDKTVYGAIAGLAIPQTVRKKAEKKGVYVLTQNGSNVSITNSPSFQPTRY